MKHKKFQLILLFCLISSAFAIATIKANSYVNESKEYIEVCSKGIVYVPLDTKFVKCNGIIRKVMGFTRILPMETDCECPKCCDGSCWVIIYGDPTPEQETENLPNSPDHSYKSDNKGDSDGYWFLWLAC
jgi:hypothetical protein